MWCWRAQEDRELTAAVQNARRNAPARQLAHGVAERASRQHATAAAGGKEVVERNRCVYRRLEIFSSGVVAERRREDIWIL